MTPEEVTAALGTGWAYEAGIGRPWGTWACGSVEVAHWPKFPEDDASEWDVSLFAGDGTSRFDCTTPEQAVAVAHLLVAAEEVAGGAEVTKAEKGRWAWRRKNDDPGYVRLHVPFNAMAAAGARRLALDLLRAARAAEAD